MWKNERMAKREDPDQAAQDMMRQWRTQRPDLDPEPMALFGRLSRADAIANRAIDATLAGHRLNRGEFDVLATLRRSGAPYRLAAGRLASSLLLSAAAMTNRLDRLETAGLVRREPDASDRRSVQVALTEEGLARVEEAVTAHVANERRLLEGLSPQERGDLSRLLARLLHSLHAAGSGP